MNKQRHERGISLFKHLENMDQETSLVYHALFSHSLMFLTMIKPFYVELEN